MASCKLRACPKCLELVQKEQVKLGARDYIRPNQVKPAKGKPCQICSLMKNQRLVLK